MRKYKKREGTQVVGSSKKIGRYLVVRGEDFDRPGEARFGIFLEKGQQRLYKSGPMSFLQAKRTYDSIRTVRNVEDYLGSH